MNQNVLIQRWSKEILLWNGNCWFFDISQLSLICVDVCIPFWLALFGYDWLKMRIVNLFVYIKGLFCELRVFTILCTLAWVVRFFVVDLSGLCPQWMSCGWIYMYMILSDHLFFYFIFSFPSQIVNRGFTDLSVESEKGSGFLQDHLPLYILLSSIFV